MIMDKQKFYDAVDMIDDDLIKEAEIAPDKLMESDGEGMTVSGVETYRRPKWSIIASVAAAAVLVLGVGDRLAPHLQLGLGAALGVDDGEGLVKRVATEVGLERLVRDEGREQGDRLPVDLVIGRLASPEIVVVHCRKIVVYQ